MQDAFANQNHQFHLDDRALVSINAALGQGAVGEYVRCRM